VTGQSGNKAEQTQLFHEYPFSAHCTALALIGQNVGSVYCCSGVVQINAAHSELLFALGIFVADWLDAYQWWRIMPQARGL
jgi:hypothetical protein